MVGGRELSTVCQRRCWMSFCAWFHETVRSLQYEINLSVYGLQRCLGLGQGHVFQFR